LFLLTQVDVKRTLKSPRWTLRARDRYLRKVTIRFKEDYEINHSELS